MKTRLSHARYLLMDGWGPDLNCIYLFAAPHARLLLLTAQPLVQASFHTVSVLFRTMEIQNFKPCQKKTGYAVLILSAYLRWKHGPVFGYMGRENFDEKVNCLLRSLDRTAIWPCYLIVIGTFFFLPDPIIKPCRAPLDRFQGTRDVKTIGFGIRYDRFGKSISIMLEESSVPALPPSRLNFEYSTSIP